MTNTKLHMLNKLNDGGNVVAAFSTFRGTRAAQTMAHTGLDVGPSGSRVFQLIAEAVIVDCEHGDTDMHDMVCAISGSGKSPLLRVKSDSAADLKRALDTGIQSGVIVPMISTPEQARTVVQRCKFPPLGVRGQGGPWACFEHHLSTPKEYVERANGQVLVMGQIETADGIQNIDGILAVDGLDAVIIGPNDLALSLLGYLPATDEKVYHDAVDAVVAAARRHGKKVGIVVVDGNTAKAALGRFDIIVLSADVRALQGWYRKELEIMFA